MSPLRCLTARRRSLPARSASLLLLFALGCSRTPPERQAGALAVNSATSVQTSAPAQPPALHRQVKPSAPTTLTAPEEHPEREFRFPAAERVVAIGDLHGDLASAREALRVAGAIDAQDHWAGGKLVLVQVGDQLDRGDDEPQILSLLERLQQEAAKAGGAVHVLNGNHELMNAVGDLRYVTEDGMRDYAAVPAKANLELQPGLPAEARGRAAAFAPGSDQARKLAERNTIAIVGDTLFAHAGVLPKHVRYGVGRINDEVRRFLRGESATMPEVANSEDAPVWTRVYGGATSSDACRELDAVLTALDVKRLVVGHTVQQTGITSACADHVYRVDVGLSDYYGKSNPTQVLELTANGVKVLTSNATSP